jgi:hypothetical protein
MGTTEETGDKNMSGTETKPTILIDTRHVQQAMKQSRKAYKELVPFWGISTHIQQALDDQMRHVTSVMRDLAKAKEALEKVFGDIASGKDVALGDIEYASLKAKQAFSSNSHEMVLTAHERIDTLAYAMRIVAAAKVED